MLPSTHLKTETTHSEALAVLTRLLLQTGGTLVSADLKSHRDKAEACGGRADLEACAVILQVCVCVC